MHSVLLAQHPADSGAEQLEQALEERPGEARSRGLGAQDRRRKLEGVAGEHGPAGAGQREQRRGLGGLGRLVDHREVEVLPGEQVHLGAGAGREDDLRLRDDPLAHAARSLARLGEEPARFPPGVP